MAAHIYRGNQSFDQKFFLDRYIFFSPCLICPCKLYFCQWIILFTACLEISSCRWLCSLACCSSFVEENINLVCLCFLASLYPFGPLIFKIMHLVLKLLNFFNFIDLLDTKSIILSSISHKIQDLIYFNLLVC